MYALGKLWDKIIFRILPTWYSAARFFFKFLKLKIDFESYKKNQLVINIYIYMSINEQYKCSIKDK